MKKYDCIFLDRDGTLNPDPGFINSLSDFKFFEFTISALSLIAKKDIACCIITNQSGLSRGIIELIELNKIHDYIRTEFRNLGVKLLDIYVCPDHPSRATSRRKPGPGMFFEAAKTYELKLKNCLMVGDSIDDIFAGKNLDMETMLVLTGKGRRTIKELSDNEQPTYIAKNIYEGFEQLCP